MSISFKRLILLTIVLSMYCFPVPASSEVVTTSIIPWSGYWWPMTNGGLATGLDYRGHPAPLEKYELLNHGSYRHSLSTWYLTYHYDPNAPSWYGHCAAWSKASISESYDILPSSENNIIFRVGDKKGLLTIAHRRDSLEVASGNADTFHYWLLHYIKDQDRPFFADLDFSEEKWYYPIYKYEMNSVHRGTTESVTVRIFYISDNVHPDYLGSKIHSQTYTYDLAVDTNGNITDGHWTGSSTNSHPELLVFPLSQRTDAPDFDYEQVKQIAQNKDDYLEHSNTTDPLPPGTYNLVLLNEDTYSIATQTGEDFHLTIEKQEGSKEPLEARLADGNENTISRTITDTSGVINMWAYDLQNPPYTLYITQPEYSDPNIYTLTVDKRKQYMQQMPFLPKSGPWIGFALTNDSNEAVNNIMLTSHDDTGVPLHTLWGPLTLAPGEKKSFLFTSLPYRKHELSAMRGLSLIADGEVQLVNLIGREELLASQVQKNASGKHIVIPVTTAYNNNRLIILGSLRNETLRSNNLTIRSYEKNGFLLDETSLTLKAHELLQVQSGKSPFENLSNDGWIDIVSDSEQQISGYSYLLNRNSNDSLFALSVTNDIKYVPHVPTQGSWTTTLTLINASDQDNNLCLHASLGGLDKAYDVNITLAPHEKKVLSLGEYFGTLPGTPLYHSLVEVAADQEFIGYFTYQEGENGDQASFPLLDASHFKSTLTMPHFPGTNHWWTGLAVGNYSAFPQIVHITAYDINGELIVDKIREITIPNGGYEIFTIASLFQTGTDDISFISCRTEVENGLLGGFYLYGAKNKNSLSGGIM